MTDATQFRRLAAAAALAPSAKERAAASERCARLRRRRAPQSSRVLASQMVQVRTEARTRPSITALTMMSADMNMPHGVRSRGNSAGAAAAGGGKAEVLFAPRFSGAAGAVLEGAGAAVAGAGAG